MAEKFVKPTRFTKEWWGYIWDYYKVHFWVALFIIGAIAITVAQVKSQPKYLMNTIYAGEHPVHDENMNNLLNDIAKELTDEENDGILFTQLYFDYSEDADIQYTVALEQKLQLEFFVDETMLYLLDEKKHGQLTDAPNYKNIWVPVSDWAEDMPSSELMINKNTVVLTNSKLLKEYGIDGSKIYMSVRHCYDKDDEKAMKRYEYSVKVANKLIEE